MCGTYKYYEGSKLYSNLAEMEEEEGDLPMIEGIERLEEEEPMEEGGGEEGGGGGEEEEEAADLSLCDASFSAADSVPVTGHAQISRWDLLLLLQW